MIDKQIWPFGNFRAINLKHLYITLNLLTHCYQSPPPGDSLLCYQYQGSCTVCTLKEKYTLETIKETNKLANYYGLSTNFFYLHIFLAIIFYGINFTQFVRNFVHPLPPQKKHKKKPNRNLLISAKCWLSTVELWKNEPLPLWK